jgi:hypothetical protein
MGRPPQVTEASQATDVRVSFLLAMDGKADKDDFRPNKVACSSFAIRCFSRPLLSRLVRTSRCGGEGTTRTCDALRPHSGRSEIQWPPCGHCPSRIAIAERLQSTLCAVGTTELLHPRRCRRSLANVRIPSVAPSAQLCRASRPSSPVKRQHRDAAREGFDASAASILFLRL